MSKPEQILISFLCLVLPVVCTFAQQKDANLWMSINLEKKITPAWSIIFTEEIRVNENITEIGEVFSDVGVSYKYRKKWKAAVHYRFSNQRRVDDSYNTKHRYYFEVTYKEKISPVVIMLRGRFQSQYTDIYSSEKGSVPVNHLNIKLTVKYDLKRNYEPYFSSECFFRLNDIRYHSFDQLRLTAGVTYTFNRMHEIDLFYRINKEYNVAHPQTDFIMGLSYYFTF